MSDGLPDPVAFGQDASSFGLALHTFGQLFTLSRSFSDDTVGERPVTPLFGHGWLYALIPRCHIFAADCRPANDGPATGCPARDNARAVPFGETPLSARHAADSLLCRDVYDYYPAMICDAVATLDLGPTMPAIQHPRRCWASSSKAFSKASKSRSGRCPTTLGGAVPFHVPGDPKDHPLTIEMNLKDGLWRFDARTVDHIPALNRIVSARQRTRWPSRGVGKTTPTLAPL